MVFGAPRHHDFSPTDMFAHERTRPFYERPSTATVSHFHSCMVLPTARLWDLREDQGGKKYEKPLKRYDFLLILEKKE